MADSETISQSIEQLLTWAIIQKAAFSRHLAAAVVPLYVTSFCAEHCTYCGYRHGARQKRLRLTEEALVKETKAVLEKGYRAIELVYPSDPTITPQIIAAHVELVRRQLAQFGDGVIGVNAHPLEVDGYRLLNGVGVDFIILWQETYSQTVYDTFHPNLRSKGSYAFRRDAPARMLRAGIRHIGMGILSGLAPWREDWVALMRHEQELFEEFGIRPSILGLPRLKPASGALVKTTEFIPSDIEFRYAVAVHTLFAPETLPWVNTREPWSLCARLSYGGGLFTFDCSTKPGGYTNTGNEAQFPTFSFPYVRYRSQVAALGLIPSLEWRFRADGGIEQAVSSTMASTLSVESIGK